MLGVTNLEKDFNGAERLELFGQEIISQISLGRTEPVEKILDEMGKKNVVRYLYNKYKDDWFLSLDDNCPYNVDDWEEIFNKYSYMSAYDVRRKLVVRNDDEGLLLILSLIFEELRRAQLFCRRCF